MKSTLDKLINKYHTVFIKRRFIGENIRLIYYLIHYTDYEQIQELLMLIDFEKAFDSISWNYIYQTLDMIQSEPSIRTWIQTFYNDI